MFKENQHVEPDRVIQEERIELMTKMNNYDKIYHSNKKYNHRPLENYFRRHFELLVD